MSDRILATLIEKVRAQQPRAIGLDIYRDLPEPPSYKELAKSFKSGESKEAIADKVLSDYKDLERVFRSTPQLVGAWKVVPPDVLPPPTLLQLGRVASVDLVDDGDNVIRRGMLVIKISKTGQELTSLGLSLALKYLRPSGIKLGIDRDYNIVLGRTTFRRLTENAGGYVRADVGGNQILLDYRPPNSFPAVSVTDVLQNKVSQNLFRDRIVLIGPTAESLKDFFLTPYSRELGGVSPVELAGVEIQANLASQIISTVLDGRIPIRTWAELPEYFFILSWSAIAVLSVWQSERWQGNKNTWGFVLLALSFCLLHCLILIIVTYLAFLQSYWLPVVPGLITIFLGTIAAIFSAFIERGRQWKIKITAQNVELAKEKIQKHLALTKARVGFWEWNLETDALAVSEEFIHLFLSDKIALPKSLKEFVEIIHVEDRDNVDKFLHYLIAENLETGEIESQTLEFRIPIVEEKDAIYHVTAHFQIDNFNKKIMGILVDCTENHLMRIADQTELRKLDCLLAQSNLFFITTIGIDCSIISSTLSTTRVLGYTVATFIGENFVSFIHLDDRAAFIRAVERSQSDFVNGEKILYRAVSKKGEWIQIESEIFNNLSNSLLNCITLYSWQRQ